MTNIIQVKNVSKIYTTGDLPDGKAGVKIKALDNVSFDIKKGEFVAIMGPSGSGKSTLMHILGALDKPTQGEYILDGSDVSNLTDDELSEVCNKKIGFVFQALNLLPRTSALKNVTIPMVYANVAKDIRLKTAEKYLKMVGLSDRLDNTPAQLSGGQQQRVAIARSLVLDPAIILADEPTGNIASNQADEIMAIFKKLNKEGRTIIMITHEPDIAENAGRIIHVKDGRIV